jgi:hypothetical protein
MFSVITNIYNKKINWPTLVNCSQPQENWKSFFFLITIDNSDYAEKWPESVQRHPQRLMGEHLISSCHRHPVSVNCLYHARMVLSVGVSFAYFARNALCTANTELLVWYSNTQNDFSPERPFSNYTHSHRQVADMWTTMKINVRGKGGRVGGSFVPSICTGFVNMCPMVFL